MDRTIGSGNPGYKNRPISDDSFMSEEVWDHDPALDKEYGISDESFDHDAALYKEYGISEETFDHDLALDKKYRVSRVATSIEIFERAAQGNWPLPGPSQSRDNNAT